MQDRKKYMLIRVDLCTMSDFTDNLDNLLEVLARYSIKATFFVSMGPDNLGQLLFTRFFNKKFIRQVCCINPFKTYGLKNLMNGLIKKGPILSDKYRYKLKRISEQGHEIGIHGYNHVKWSNYYMTMKSSEIKEEIRKSMNKFKSIFGDFPLGFSAPSWGCNFNTLAAEDEHNFLYASDTRGNCPFFPKINSRVFKILQIPVTLPTFFELLSGSRANRNSVVERLALKIKQNKINVFIVHPCQEGNINKDIFVNLLERLKNNNIVYVKHKELAKEKLINRIDIPVCEVGSKQVFGAFRDVGEQLR